MTLDPNWERDFPWSDSVRDLAYEQAMDSYNKACDNENHSEWRRIFRLMLNAMNMRLVLVIDPHKHAQLVRRIADLDARLQGGSGASDAN